MLKIDRSEVNYKTRDGSMFYSSFFTIVPDWLYKPDSLVK